MDYIVLFLLIFVFMYTYVPVDTLRRLPPRLFKLSALAYWLGWIALVVIGIVEVYKGLVDPSFKPPF